MEGIWLTDEFFEDGEIEVFAGPGDELFEVNLDSVSIQVSFAKVLRWLYLGDATNRIDIGRAAVILGQILDSG